MSLKTTALVYGMAGLMIPVSNDYLCGYDAEKSNDECKPEF